ncbi:MAG: adenylosuccinate synthase [bacterium]|nr:adenylosuccinate synthase [bacterium]
MKTYFGREQVVGLCGAGWGDEGKGKFTDEFAGEADVVVRAQGGCNAGHTVVIGEKRVKLHHVPSGIAQPGTVNVIGNGVVVDPRVLVEEEFSHLRALGIEVSGLRISGDAHVVMPWHRVLDRAREWSLGGRRIGTTARGIGPAYADKVLRGGIRVNDLYDAELFREKVRVIAEEKEKVVREVYGVSDAQIEEWMSGADQERGLWWRGGHFDAERIAESYLRWAEAMRPHVTETRKLLWEAWQAGRKILMEGAQGLLLDIDHGTYPYVTSSSCGAAGFASGSGLPPRAIERVYSVMSAYMTRVGSGPFPTELGTEAAIANEHAGARMSREEAVALAGVARDEYTLGKVIRHIAGEFGTTTGRPRRTGWFDAVACRRAVQMNGPDVIVSKLDVLDVLPVVKICTAYRYEGPSVEYNGKRLESGAMLEEFPADARILAYCRPAEMREVRGWQTDTGSCRTYRELPLGARRYLQAIEETTGARVRMVSVGPQRHQTLMR